MTFADFLALLHKEAFFRDALSEAQMYRLSPMRMTYGQEVALVTQHQLDLLKQLKKQSGADTE